jgi:hypothetical protein
MKPIGVVMLLVVALAPAVNSQSPDSRSPHDQLGQLTGRWTIEERYAGDSSKYVKTSTCDLFAGGQHLVCHAEADTPLGRSTNLSILSHDQSAKVFTQYTITNVGVAALVTGTVTETSWVGDTEFRFNGDIVKARVTITHESPTSWTSKIEGMFGGSRTVVMQEARATKAP